MSLFEIPVGDLLESFEGDSKTLAFSGEVYDGYYETISFTSPLELEIQIIHTADGISVIFQRFHTTVQYEGHTKDIELTGVERVFKRHKLLTDPDDIGQINNKHSSIDLTQAIAEEILIQCIE